MKITEAQRRDAAFVRLAERFAAALQHQIDCGDYSPSIPGSVEESFLRAAKRRRRIATKRKGTA